VATSGQNLQGKEILLVCLFNELVTLDEFLRFYTLCFITKISDVSKITRSRRPASIGFLLGLPFGTEDGDDMSLRNIWFSPIYAA
jgi:hypothetical protein